MGIFNLKSTQSFTTDKAFFYVTNSHYQKIQKIQIMLSVNILKLAALTFNIYVSVICQFINVHHNIRFIRFIISDDNGSHFVKSDKMYE